MMDQSEKRFEQDIESFLISEAGGYEQFSYLNPDGHRIHKYVYDKDKAIYLEVLIHFIMKTQPKQWERYVKYYGKDALLLTVLAYNVGHSRLLGYGKRPKSNLIKKIESGDRDIYEEYISYRCYKGKPIPSIERRRKIEFQLLYIP